MLALSAPASQRHKYIAAVIEDVGREAASLCPVSSLSTALAETASRTARTNLINLLDEPKLRYISRSISV